jgi:hypothetical protein
MAQSPALGRLLGESQGFLTWGVPPWEGGAEAGVVAGTTPGGPWEADRPLTGVSDGTVLLSETELPGITAHATLPRGHTELAFSGDAADLAWTFYARGHSEARGWVI